MGCDIHCYAERLRGGKWVMIKNPIGDGHYKEDAVLRNRDYRLFALLADVRNEHEVDRLDITNPGFPVYMSDGVWRKFKGWQACSHSHGWVTLENLMNFDWEGTLEVCYSGGDDVNKTMTYRQFLDYEDLSDFTIEPSELWSMLDRFRTAYPNLRKNKIRLVFWFDN